MPRMLLAVSTNHISHHLETFIWLRVIEPPLQKDTGQEDNGKPLLNRLVRLYAKIAQTQQVLNVKIVYLDRPTLLIESQYLLWR
jgi:hypothetical protein